MKKHRTAIIKSTLFMLVTATGFAFTASAQQNNISAKFLSYQENTLQEKLFVHTDKTAYLAGEIAWLKIYVTDGLTHKPSDVSKIAYVDIIDNNQAPVMQAKIAIKGGSGSGSVYIPVNMGSGNYKLRAYTSWMKNFAPDYYFNKTITIINPLKSPSAPIAATKQPGFDVQFFPEGGNMVRDLAGKVGFKITGTDGKGMDADGAIVNQQNDTIVRFRPFKFGMGSFMFTPTANAVYRAVLKSGSAKPVTKQLPAIQEQGYAVQVTDADRDKVEVVVKSNVASAGSVVLFVHTRQVSKIAETASMVNNTARFVIDKAKLGDGVSHITIFNSANQPVAERLIFKQPTQKLVLNATSDQEQYTGRKKVSLSIAAVNQSAQAVASDLSVSVYRLDSLQKGDEGSMLSYVWLASDLKGKIEAADYYFNKPDSKTNEALNNLLLTQGWSRYDWDKILSNKPAPIKFLPEIDGHIITGKVVSSLTGAAASDIIVHMGVPGKRIQYYNSKSDEKGNILFNTSDYYGSNELILQTDPRKDSTLTLTVNSPFSESFTSEKTADLELNADMLKIMPQLSVGMQAQNIYNGKKQNQFYDPQVDSTAFFTPDKSYLLDNYTRFTTIEEVFREYIADANVAKRQGKFQLRVYNGEEYMDGEPLVLIDGVPILDIDKVFLVDPLKIRTLAVLPQRYHYGSTITTGVISLGTYKNDLGGYELNPHAAIVDYEGLQLQRIFYSPAYDTAKQIDSTIPDFRSTLYWQPNAGTNNTGKKDLSFFTSDVNGKYIGVVHGTTANGEVGSTTFTFEVKNAAL
jgi:hypothetical protein